MSVDLSCLELIWLFFPSESPSFQIPIIEKLSFQLVRLEIWHLLLSHFIHPLSFNPICSTFKIFEISTILSIPSPLFWFLSSLSSHSVSYQSGTFCQQILIEWNFPGLLVKARGSWKLFCVGSSLMEATNILDPWPRMANGWTQFCLCLRKATQLVREPLLFLPCLEVLCIFFPANE